MAHYALRKAPRTTTRALSDCIVTRADGSSYVIPKTPAPDAATLAAREAAKLANAKRRARERANAKVDAQNAIDRRRVAVGNFKLESIHDPRGW